MKVKIRGGSERQKELVQDIALYAAEKLMSSRLRKGLTVHIKIATNLLAREGIYGDCIWNDDNTRPKEFIIRADRSMRQRRLLETVAHEMVHVKQFATGELKDYLINSNLSKYRGLQYDKRKLDYYDYPWEIEAHGREVGIFVRWAEDRGYGKYPWAQDPK